MSNKHEHTPPEPVDYSRDDQFRAEFAADPRYAEFLSIDEYLDKRRSDFASVIER